MSQTVTKPIEVMQVHERVVSCEGSGGQLGHPKVYLRVQAPLGHDTTQIACPYCSRLFVLSGAPMAEGH